MRKGKLPTSQSLRETTWERHLSGASKHVEELGKRSLQGEKAVWPKAERWQLRHADGQPQWF
jgi:hypothetical protein